MRCALALLALCACGDNLRNDGEPLAPSGDLVVVAHQDDDLYFMQPDLLEAVQGYHGLTSVYVTAGNGVHGAEWSERRYEGLRYAYGAAAGSTDWRCGWIALAGHVAEHCRLADKPVSLVFLGYPDGGVVGESADSLLHLWEGTIDRAETVAYRPTSYSRDELIDTLSEIMRETRPTTVRTLEIAATHGDDHSDHMIAGALALLAMARAESNADLISYRAYSITSEPANKLPPLLDVTFDMLSYYEACSSACGPCGEPCTTIDDSHVAWLSRRYAVGFRPAAAGRLRIDSMCLASDLGLAPCDTAPAWRLGTDRSLRDDDGRCVQVAARGDVSLGECEGGSGGRFFLDDEGHMWSGVPPVPQAGLDYAHLWCLAPTDEGGIRARACGRDAAPAWELAPRTVSTARTDLGFAATGRDVRLGDVNADGRDDLCTIDRGALICDIGDGAGGFITPAARVDDPQHPLAIDPSSLTFGDVDGDQRVDACGRDRDGVLCATAARSFAATRWSSSFADAVAGAGTSASLAAVDADADGVAEICGIDAAGVVCAPRDSQPDVLSAWPDANALVWPGDLDGDGRADWCTASDAGLACGVAAERGFTTDGGSWAFAQDGVVTSAPASSATAGAADIDGDGRVDLCSQREDRVVCVRSQGRGFGPRTTLAVLPNAAASALWLGDLDGDGRADACTDDGDAIVCAVEPVR